MASFTQKLKVHYLPFIHHIGVEFVQFGNDANAFDGIQQLGDRLLDRGIE
jgi:hypothetical protein